MYSEGNMVLFALSCSTLLLCVRALDRLEVDPSFLAWLKSAAPFPRLIHVTSPRHFKLFDNSSGEALIRNGVGNLARLNPDWHVVQTDNFEMMLTLKRFLHRADYLRLNNTHFVERGDLWRLIQVYEHGGIYMDIDRTANVHLSKVFHPQTRVFLSTYFWPNFHDFCQDLIISAPNNPMLKLAIDINLKRRADCFEKTNRTCEILWTGPNAYMEAVTKTVFGRAIGQGSSGLWEPMKEALQRAYPYISFREDHIPCNTTLFRPELGSCPGIADKYSWFNRQGRQHGHNNSVNVGPPLSKHDFGLDV
eukprot:g26622.t1